MYILDLFEFFAKFSSSACVVCDSEVLLSSYGFSGFLAKWSKRGVSESYKAFIM